MAFQAAMTPSGKWSRSGVIWRTIAKCSGCRRCWLAIARACEASGVRTLFRSDHYADISLAQWMGVLPPELVKAHLNVDDKFIASLPKSEPLVR